MRLEIILISLVLYFFFAMSSVPSSQIPDGNSRKSKNLSEIPGARWKFPILELQNPSIDVSKLLEVCRSTDSEALRL